MSLAITQTGAALGAEIAGVDLTRPIDDTTFEQIRRAFYKYEVIYFRGQELSDEDHIRFSARFGKLRKLKAGQYSGRHPEINVVSNILENGKLIGSNDAGLIWHTDGAYFPISHVASILHALEVPEQSGRTLGDTRFASVSAAYDALPESMKKHLDGLQAVQSHNHKNEKAEHSGHHRDPTRIAAKVLVESVHPVVKVHPVNGRKCLYVSEAYTARILGLPDDESRELIEELAAHCVKPEFQYIHNWRVHDLIMWDDCSTQHKATFDYKLPQRRRMHRTTVIGSGGQEEPSGSALPY